MTDSIRELKMYTMNEVAEILNCDIHHVALLRDYNLIRCTKIGKGYMFSREEILRFQRDCIGHDLSNKRAIEKYAKDNNLGVFRLFGSGSVGGVSNA